MTTTVYCKLLLPWLFQKSTMGLCCSRNSVVNKHVSVNPPQPRRTTADKRLESLDPEFVTDVPHKGEYVRVKVSKVYDGDTLTFIFLHGGTFPLKLKLRILNIDAPEIKVPYSSASCDIVEAHTSAGISVRDIVSTLVLNKILWAKFDRWDKYGGRVDGDIFLESKFFNMNSFEDVTEYGIPLSKWLINQGLVHEYNGKGSRDSWTLQELLDIHERCKYLHKLIV